MQIYNTINKYKLLNDINIDKQFINTLETIYKVILVIKYI